MSLSNVDIY